MEVNGNSGNLFCIFTMLYKRENENYLYVEQLFSSNRIKSKMKNHILIVKYSVIWCHSFNITSISIELNFSSELLKDMWNYSRMG